MAAYTREWDKAEDIQNNPHSKEIEICQSSPTNTYFISYELSSQAPLNCSQLNVSSGATGWLAVFINLIIDLRLKLTKMQEYLQRLSEIQLLSILLVTSLMQHMKVRQLLIS